jgi:hypothetical protein
MSFTMKIISCSLATAVYVITLIYIYRSSWVRFPIRSFGFFSWPNHMPLESTQRLIEMSTRNLPGVKGWLAHKADNLTTICELIVQKCGSLDDSQPYGASMACYRDSFTLICIWKVASTCDMYVCTVHNYVYSNVFHILDS